VLIVTDGVFSMDGDLARSPSLIAGRRHRRLADVGRRAWLGVIGGGAL